MENIEDVYTCPSFNSYSSNRLAEIAVKVAAEKNEETGDDEDFEFSLVREDKEFSAEDFASEGQIGPIFPVFNRDIWRSNGGASGENDPSETRIAVPLGKLFFEDHGGDNPPSCSSSEADELENVPAGSFCVWRPKAADPPSPSRCKKSNSTGSASKRWRFLDLLRRSNSEGKDSFVFLTPKSKEETEEKPQTESVQKTGKGKGACGSGSGSGAAPITHSAHEALYVRNRTIKEGDKRKTYLPYRRDLVGFFVNVNVLSKSFPHF